MEKKAKISGNILHWIFGVAITIFQLVFVIVHFSEFFRVYILRTVDEYPFGIEGMPFFMSNYVVYSIYNLSISLVYTLFLVLSLRFLFKMKSFELLINSLVFIFVFIVLLYINFSDTNIVE